MSSRWPISRRTMLQGLGAAVALPLLDAMAPGVAGSVANAATEVAGAGSAGGAPLRMASFFLPNGMVMEDWTPSSIGTGFELPPISRKLAGSPP